MNNIFIIGTGLTGLTIARKLSDKGIKSTIIDKRNKLGGNCSVTWHNNIEVHDYGPHILHTDDKEIWDFMCRFTEFNHFKLNTLASVGNKKYHLPFGLDLINSFFNLNLSPSDVDDFMNKQREHIQNPKNLEEQALNLVGRKIYESFIYGYTKKQWNREPKELPAEIIKRIPVRNTYDNNYYNDVYQGIPLNGYDVFFKNMIDDENIKVILNKDFTLNDINENDIYFYSGAIDELLEYRYEPLDWRSLKFEITEEKINDYQGNAIINYPEYSKPYTRIHEYKHFHPEIDYSKNHSTIICKEFPVDYLYGLEKYYPINTEENQVKYILYSEYIKEKYPNIILCGRLAKYKYFDMDDAIKDAMNVVNNFLKNNE